jgi:hypothetical protein
MSRRRIIAGVAVLGAMAVAGCYASTEPATDVGPETARLQAQGTADNGPASSFFEYWLTGTTGRVLTTTPLHWPAGASGPFSQRVSGLAASASYSFRVCGSDDAQPQTSCAQTRTFTTAPAVEDSVTGHWIRPCCFTGQIDARSGPSGQNPRGSVRHTEGGAFGPSFDFTGFVTCLAVNGRRAAIGSVGRLITTPPGGSSTPATSIVTVEDGQIAGEDTVRVVRTAGSTPPDCATASFANQEPLDPRFGSELIVNDSVAGSR